MTTTGGRPRREDGRNCNTVAATKYNTGNYDRINFYIKKGQKEKIKEEATKNGETVNTFINRIISENVDGFDPLKQENSKGYKKNC